MNTLTITVPGPCGRVPLPPKKTIAPLFYTPKSRLPVVYKTKQFAFRVHQGEVLLTNLRTGMLVMRAALVSKTIIEEKIRRIKGQEFYSGFGAPGERMKLVEAYKSTLKQPILACLKGQVLPPFPWQVRVELHRPAGAANWDVDNGWILSKCFLDLLQTMKIIPNDNIQYITRAGEVSWVAAKEEQTCFHITTDVAV